MSTLIIAGMLAWQGYVMVRGGSFSWRMVAGGLWQLQVRALWLLVIRLIAALLSVVESSVDGLQQVLVFFYRCTWRCHCRAMDFLLWLGVAVWHGAFRLCGVLLSAAARLVRAWFRASVVRVGIIQAGKIVSRGVACFFMLFRWCIAGN